jgi:hypothetical protein
MTPAATITTAQSMVIHNGYSGSLGERWRSVDTPMLPDAYIGLCVTSHNVNTTCIAEFSDIDINPAGSVTGDW